MKRLKKKEMKITYSNGAENIILLFASVMFRCRHIYLYEENSLMLSVCLSYGDLNSNIFYVHAYHRFFL